MTSSASLPARPRARICLRAIAAMLEEMTREAAAVIGVDLRAIARALGGEVLALPSKAVTARFDISRRTLDRWMRDVTLVFPRPLVINRRLYFSLSEIEAWETECVKRHAAKIV
jgi:predicted DNA-binding transcriptional regulator AlpA